MTTTTLSKQLAGRLGILAAGVAVSALLAGTALADPAVIYDLGGKFDKSFNEAAFNGATQWAKDTGGTFHDLEIQAEAQREQAVRKFAQAGYSPIVVTGFSFADTLTKVAPRLPEHPLRADRLPSSTRRTSSRWSTSPTTPPTLPACSPPRPPRPARSASSAAWTSR